MIYVFDRILRGVKMAQGIKIDADSLSSARREARRINRRGRNCCGVDCGGDGKRTLVDDKNTVLKLRNGGEK